MSFLQDSWTLKVGGPCEPRGQISSTSGGNSFKKLLMSPVGAWAGLLKIRAPSKSNLHEERLLKSV